MYQRPILTLAALSMVIVALIVCHAAQRVEPAVRLLPIDRFPNQIGEWQAGPNLTTDAAIQRRIPTAKITERNYLGVGGKIANLLLLTATDDEDYHLPTACLPGQGWTLHDQKTVLIDGHAVNTMVAEKEGASFTVVYYWVKLEGRAGPRPGSPLDRIYRLRQLIDHESLSLFVRIAMPAGLQDRPDLLSFAGLTWNALQPILGGKAEIVLQS